MIILLLILIAIVAFACWFYRHQQLLKDRAHLMREAIHNRDFTFHLPVKGLFFGERALQEALNDMGKNVRTLVAQKEVESWQRLTRVLTHEIMNATAPIRANIREGKIFQIPSAIATGKADGMFSLDQDLARLVRNGKITDELAQSKCQNPAEYKRFLTVT